ncbi:MAG TPA: SgcJ/EcaC family oxidoreductase [Terriglobales bacterium]|nr:SgcJ/EcaC family oxidoreductase [Terriglobales bacterium]
MAQVGVPRGIQRLHDEDVAATLAFDPQRLANLFTEDAVLLEPGAPPQIGRAAFLALNVRDAKQHPNGKCLEYKAEVHDLRLHNDWAVEWTTFTAAFQDKPDAPVQRFKGRALRVLRREPDGSWKFSHVAWNAAE